MKKPTKKELYSEIADLTRTVKEISYMYKNVLEKFNIKEDLKIKGTYGFDEAIIGGDYESRLGRIYIGLILPQKYTHLFIKEEK